MKTSFLFLFLFSFLTISIAQKDLKNHPIAQLDSIFRAMVEQGEYDAIFSFAEAAVLKAEKELGKKDTLYALMVYNLGQVYDYEFGEYDTALKYYKEAASIQKSKTPQSIHYANSIIAIANVYSAVLDKHEIALPYYLEAQSIRTKNLGAEHTDVLDDLNNLAALYIHIGEFELALPLLIKVKNSRAKTSGVQDIKYATALNNLAALYDDMGQFELALPLYIDAKNITAKVLGTEDFEYASSLNNLAGVYKSIDKIELALPLYLEAKEIKAKTLGVQDPSYANTLNSLASLYHELKRFDLALPLYLESQSIIAKTVGKEHPAYPNSLTNLSVLYREMGKFDLAISLNIEAKNVHTKISGLEHPAYINSLNTLAVSYLQNQDIELAWQTINAALSASSGIAISNHIHAGWVDSLFNAHYLSNVHIERMVESLDIVYRLLSAAPTKTAVGHRILVADLANALLTKLRNSHSDSNDKLRLLAKNNDWLLKSLKVLDLRKDAQKAFEIADKNKSVLLLEASKSEKAYQLGNLPDSLVAKEKSFFKQKDELLANLLEKRPANEKDSLRSLLIEINQDIEAFKKSLEKQYPKYANFKYQQMDVKVQDVQKSLDDKTAFLEYVIGDSVVYIFYIDKQNLKCTEFLIPNSELEKQIKTLHKVLSDYKNLIENKAEAYQQYTETAHWFYKNLVANVLKGNATQNISKLIIVTDGKLGHLPFEAFLVKEAPQAQTDYAKLHYLLQDYSISYNYSATLFVDAVRSNDSHPNTSVRKEGQVFAMAANYNIQLDTPNTLRLPTYQLLRGMLKPLPAARKEVEVLEKEYQGFFAFDTLASEKIFKERAGNYSVIHLAMHGLLDSKSPILSSLAFTEDGDSLENNFLQAYEISKLELNADLVILSACETGYGKFEKGNGIASLARAFMYAGASSLIVSLWQVNDFATAEIMKKLYQNLASGMDKAEALRQAKLDYIQSAKGITAHPAFWSPFIQIGNTDSIYLATKRGSSLVWWCGGGVLLLAIGLVIWRRRAV